MKSTAFVTDAWHSAPACDVQVVTLGAAQGNGLGLWCKTCHAYCDMEATGMRVSVAESMVAGRKYADIVKARPS